MSKKDQKETINRREFLKIGVMTATTAAVGLSGLRGVLEAANQQNPGVTPPVFRTLGRTGLKVTVVSFGAMLTPEHEVMRAAFDLGINYVDTARKYMGGRNEETVGKAIKGIRDRLYIATKPTSTSTSKKDIMKDVETSLTKLGTDHVDVIQLHGLTNSDRAFIPEVREAFIELRTQGKVRFFGVTTHTNQAQVVNAIVDDKDKFFDTVLVAHNFKSSPDISQAIARAAKAGIGVIAMKTQAGGYKTDLLGAVEPSPGCPEMGASRPQRDLRHPGHKGHTDAERSDRCYGDEADPCRRAGPRMLFQCHRPLLLPSLRAL